ncbi:recombinase RecT [Rhizobium sp. AB2/73]|nr:recombinase RecT [Rhizobium sp. AB2/73]UEQ82856.1 recombinase RecT [Rhizobium sp. AB2/73]
MPALAGGGQVMAIVPQTFEETFRIAKAVYLGGLAPAALIGKLNGDDAVSAVTVAIMAGAELGLKPMVSLRSFTVINGRPALYGDGIINVVRSSGRVEVLKTGYAKDDKKILRDAGMLPSKEAEAEDPGITAKAFAALTEDERTFGYCVAKRADTGEEKTVVFSVADAKHARLWDDRATVKKPVWENGQKVWKEGQPNDAPWYRFQKRMLAWRAAGYCLRELFGDVLGGIRDEFEAREIADLDDIRDVTPQDEQPAKPMPPVPPKPPVEDAEVVDVTNQPETGNDDGTEAPATDETDAGAQETIPDDNEYFEQLEEAMAVVSDAESLEEVWVNFDPLARFDGKPQGEVNQGIALAIRKRAEKRIGGAA